MSMLGSNILNRMATRLRFQDAVMRSMARVFEKALQEGRIEVVPIAGPPEDCDHTTIH
jgi:hypothetical protein